MSRKHYMVAFIALLWAVFAQTAGAAELVIGTRVEPSMDPHSQYVTATMAYSKHIFGTLTQSFIQRHIS